MEENENIFDKLKDLAGNFKGNFNIMENQVDINIQMEYFKYSKAVKANLNKEEILAKRELLLDEKTSLAEKKHLLSQLASIEDVKAYRTIEKYLNNPGSFLKNWAIMALHENRMLLESDLLDENQIFISTGLGGKGTKLRYFIVLFHKTGDEFNQTQQKIINNEFDFVLSENDSEIEEIYFSKTYSSLLVLIPIKSTIQEMMKKSIDECNQYGNFIKENFIITNVKKLDFEEIQQFIAKNKIDGISNDDSINKIDEV